VTQTAETGVRGPDASTKLAVERTVLAHDRTMLSWVRTATALISFGFSIQQFFLIARQGTPENKGLFGPNEFGLIMIGIGLLALLLAALNHRSAIQIMKAQYPVAENYPDIPRSKAAMLAALIGILGLLAFFSMIFRG
jgi:putative membrane protein